MGESRLVIMSCRGGAWQQKAPREIKITGRRIKTQLVLSEDEVAESDAKKIPKTKIVFGGVKSNQTRVEPISFFYPDCYCRLRSCAGSCFVMPN